MKIGELAVAAQCSPETIRYYEKAGLLPPPSRAQNNYRYYSNAHLERLRLIRNCRKLGMSHEEIRSLLHALASASENCEPINSLLDEHIRHVDARIRELANIKEELLALRRRCAEGGALERCGIIEGLNAMEPGPAPGNRSHLN